MFKFAQVSRDPGADCNSVCVRYHGILGAVSHSGLWENLSRVFMRRHRKWLDGSEIHCMLST